MEEGPYLILYGAPTSRGSRPVIHIGHERNGEVVPRCNSHLTATHDREPRKFRPVEGDEASYRVCQRCQNWRGWSW